MEYPHTQNSIGGLNYKCYNVVIRATRASLYKNSVRIFAADKQLAHACIVHMSSCNLNVFSGSILYPSITAAIYTFQIIPLMVYCTWSHKPIHNQNKQTCNFLLSLTVRLHKRLTFYVRNYIVFYKVSTGSK